MNFSISSTSSSTTYQNDIFVNLGGNLTTVTSGDGSEHAVEGGQSSQGGIIVKETRTKGQKNISESGIAVWPEKSDEKILKRIGSTTLAPGETTIDVDKVHFSHFW